MNPVKNLLSKIRPCLVIVSTAVCLVPHPVCAAPLVRQGAGANPAAIQAIVDQFRTDLGGANNGVGGTFATGRREVNWDGVPDANAAPNFLAPDFFNVTSARGIVFNTLEIQTGGGLNDFMVSADSSNPTATPVRFGDLDPSYTATFQAFSAQRLFIARNTNAMEAVFFVPGTKIPATVSGFGCVFTDVDTATASTGRAALIRAYGADGNQLVSFTCTAASGGLSFGGVSFTAGERVARCVIQMGNSRLATGTTDSVTTDVVAMDDVIYGEPQPLQITNANGVKIEAGVPLKFLSITATGAPAGFLNATLQCSPHHVYELFQSTDLVTWAPAVVTGAPAGNTNQFNPRATWSSTTLAATLQLSKAGQPRLFYRAVDETNNEAASIEFPGP